MSHPVRESTPIKVEITNHPEPENCEVRSAYRSAVLTSTNPFTQIAGFDSLREAVHFSPAANSFIICGNVSQASDPNNLIALTTNPNGRYVPANANFDVIAHGQNELWVTGGTYPTIIGYEIVRKVPSGD